MPCTDTVYTISPTCRYQGVRRDRILGAMIGMFNSKNLHLDVNHLEVGQTADEQVQNIELWVEIGGCATDGRRTMERRE